ncbi:MAG: hypothetical protein K2L25_03955 [Alphaproteobacteria bacterium]|nr:hypothetical protein [Alphaproteobacteria bacterium]
MKKIFLFIALAQAVLVVNSAMATNAGICGISDIKAGTCTGAAAGYGVVLGHGHICHKNCVTCSKDSTQNCNTNTYNITFEQDGCKDIQTTCYNGIPIKSCSECNTGYVRLSKQIPWCNNAFLYQVCRKKITNDAECPTVFTSDWGVASKGTNLIESYSQSLIDCASSDVACAPENVGDKFCDRFYYYGCADGYYNAVDENYSKDYKLIKCNKCPTPPETWMQKYLHSAYFYGNIEPARGVESCYVGGAEDGLYTDDIGTFEWEDGCYGYVE